MDRGRVEGVLAILGTKSRILHIRGPRHLHLIPDRSNRWLIFTILKYSWSLILVVFTCIVIKCISCNTYLNVIWWFSHEQNLQIILFTIQNHIKMAARETIVVFFLIQLWSIFGIPFFLLACQLFCFLFFDFNLNHSWSKLSAQQIGPIFLLIEGIHNSSIY